MTAGLFDAVTYPKWRVFAAVTAGPTSNVCVRGTGVRGTNIRGAGTGAGAGGAVMADISATSGGVYSIRSIRRSSFGRPSPLEPASAAQVEIVFNNISGSWDPSNPASPFYPLLTINCAVQVVAEWPASVYTARFTGKVADIEVDAGMDPTVTLTCVDGLEQLGRTQLPVEQPQFDNDLTGQRIANLADRAAWSSVLRRIDDGNDHLAPTVLGATAAELMRQVEATESGYLFVDEQGYLVFYDRYRTTTAGRSMIPQASIEDTSAAGTFAMIDLISARSLERVYNDIHITRDPDPSQDPALTGAEGGDVPVEQVAQDTTSIGPNGQNYGYLNLPVDVGKLHRTDAAALQQAQGLLAWYANPGDRIREVHINGLHPKVAIENLYAKLLGLTLLDRVAVSRDYGPNTIAGELLIQGIEEVVESDPPTWELRLTTSNPTPAPSSPCIRGSGQRGTDQRVW